MAIYCDVRVIGRWFSLYTISPASPDTPVRTVPARFAGDWP
jgi:hypothetical protein